MKRTILFYLILIISISVQGQQISLSGDTGIIADSKLYFIPSEAQNPTFVHWNMVTFTKFFSESIVDYDSTGNEVATCTRTTHETDLFLAKDASNEIIKLTDSIAYGYISECDIYDGYYEGMSIGSIEALDHSVYVNRYYGDNYYESGEELLFINELGPILKYYFEIIGDHYNGCLINAFWAGMETELYFTTESIYIIGYFVGSGDIPVRWNSLGDTSQSYPPFKNLSLPLGKPFCIKLNKVPQGTDNDLSMLYFEGDSLLGSYLKEIAF